MPAVERLGIQLVPGRKYKLVYSKKRKVFLPAPYSTCSSQVTPGMQGMFDQFSGAKYDYALEICFKVALQTYMCVNMFVVTNSYMYISTLSRYE